GSVLLCFFQAEDGIRDRNVTGVQTCALPICYPVVNPTLSGSRPLEPAAAAWVVLEALGEDGQRELVARTARATRRLVAGLSTIRSEERRGGEECRRRRGP